MAKERLKLKRSYLNEESRANLLDFIQTQDRSSPPIFAGRENILERIKNDVARCRSNTDSTECFTVVIHGAPGAGKTSLLNEIEKQLKVGSSKHRGAQDFLAVVRLYGDTFSSQIDIAKKIIEVCSGERSKIEEESTTVSWGARFFGFGPRRQRATRVKSLDQQIQSPSALWDAALESTKVDRESTTFLLLVDEAQTIPQNVSESSINSVVMQLHSGFQNTHGLKIVPVFAGLSDTESVLAKRGASRLGTQSSIQLQALTQDETEELVTEWMHYEAFGFGDLFTAADIAKISKMVALASEGWPRHTNAYLREFGRALLSQDSSEMTLDLEEVLDRGNDSRVDYYSSRLDTAELGAYELVILDAMKQSTDGLVELEELISIARDRYDLIPSDTLRLHENVIHAGVLSRMSRQNGHQFKPPIPSFSTYMQCRRDTAKFKERMRQQMEEKSHLWRST